MLKRILPLVVIVLSLVAAEGIALAGGGQSSVAQARKATARFHKLATAQAAGYTTHVHELSGASCIANEPLGAMGDHFANGALLGDGGVIDATAPEALVYDQRKNGTYKLAALEYLVFQADWEAAGHTSPPVLFGRTFDFTDSPNRFGIPPYYSLHAWIWKPNPSGLFFAWNPNVECEE
jgi:hypothetical protein